MNVIKHTMLVGDVPLHDALVDNEKKSRVCLCFCGCIVITAIVYSLIASLRQWRQQQQFHLSQLECLDSCVIKNSTMFCYK